MKLERNRNAVFSLKYHVILVVKYRRKAFKRKAILDRMKEIAVKIGGAQGVTIEEMNGEPDHIHLFDKRCAAQGALPIHQLFEIRFKPTIER